MTPQSCPRISAVISEVSYSRRQLLAKAAMVASQHTRAPLAQRLTAAR
jgi:hypothetical protein